MSDQDYNSTNKKSPISRYSALTRYFYIGMALLLMLIVFIGFWPSYFGPILQGNEMTMRLPEMITPWVIHLHVFVFMGWFVALLIQATLIARKKIDLHMKLGRLGVYLGGSIVAVGLLVLFMRDRILMSAFEEATLSMIPLVESGIYLQLVIFAVLLTLGYRNRKNPESHKRYMLFATMAIMPAATNRWYFLPWSEEIIFILLMSIVMGHDYLTTKQIHKVTWIGAGLLLINIIVFALPFTTG
ncbi:MAG: hypothetical protein GVY07_10795 [Bacteroidetes bacterium]|jgi:hypothetical protein|nr:hypothetical protein [Bacteroidota bacterium]